MALLNTFPLDARTYEFEWLRRFFEVGRQEGVDAAGDFKVTDGAGADLKVDVAAGLALVKGDTGFRNGLYLQLNDAVIANAVTFDAAHATLPRIDQVILRVGDSDDLGSAGDVPAIEKLTGAATAGATLDNRNGATALPNDCLRLADVLVPAAATSLLAANIRDRRTWARGAYFRVQPPTGANYTTTSSSPADLDATNFPKRLELSGAPVEFALVVPRASHSAAAYIALGLAVDGSLTVEQGTDSFLGEGTAGAFFPSALRWAPTPAAGSHIFNPRWSTEAATATVDRSVVGRAPIFTGREDVRQNATND